jgi:hypothetical protein
VPITKAEGVSVEAAERRLEERSIFVHGEIIHRLRKAKTHAKTGDLGIAKMLEVGFKSTSEIQATRVSANATAGAQATVVPIDIYKPLWLRESEAQMLAESRKRYSQPVQQIEARSSRKMTAEQAKAYLTAAGGDKDKAREAARKDGWEF